MKKSNLEIEVIKKALEARYDGVIRLELETDWEAIDKHAAERAIFAIRAYASGAMNPERARALGEALVEAANVVDVLNAQEWRIRYNLKVDRDELKVYGETLAKRVAAGVPVEDVIALIPEM